MPVTNPNSPPEQQGIGWKPLAAGAATAAGAYGLMRRGGKGGPLNRVVQGQKGKQPSWIGQQVDRILYGADNTLYKSPNPMGGKKRVRGTVLHEVGSEHQFSGDTNLGGASNPIARGLTQNKLNEAEFIQKHAPTFATGAKPASQMGRGEELLNALGKSRDAFFVKPSGGFASGVGGEKFVRAQDIKAYRANRKSLPPEKLKAIESMLADPGSHLYQRDLGIEKGRFSGANSEVRVHAIGGKVVPGATSVRGGNWEDTLRHREAEEYFQKFLNKAPKSMHRDGTAWAPDIAFTKDGPKILELNAGGLNSGLLDPKHMLATHGAGPKGVTTAFSAMRNNLAIYKHMTGRAHMAEAAPKALGYGAAAAGGVGLAQRQGPEEPRRRPGI